ncbi:cyclase family protein [Limibacter armeniacum]|uniref:cyclase family protein n=1 Tax=Limibacter armeniacum TaxID=466084 RepID=UPI002FE60F19
MNKAAALLHVICSFLLLMGCQQKGELSFPSNWVDLSHSYDSTTLYWPTSPVFKMDTVFEGQTDKGYYYSAYQFCTAEHGGTHMDAPVHFAEGKQEVDQVPLKTLTGEGVVVDLASIVNGNADYLITAKDLQQWFDLKKIDPSGKIILMHTGFGKFWPDAKKYLGTDMRGDEAVPQLHFPGLSEDGANWAVEKKVKSIGLDTPSIDYGQSTDFMAHRVLFAANIPAFENLANLDKLVDHQVWVVALPMKLKGGSGAPLRIIAAVHQ